MKTVSKYLFYTSTIDSINRPIRYLTALEKLCVANGLQLAKEFPAFEGAFSDSLTKEAHNMDSLLERRFGKQFKAKLCHQADSIFIKNSRHKIIWFSYCDSWPHPKDKPENKYKKDKNDPYRVVVLKPSFQKTLPVDQYGNLPSFFLSFLVGKNGSLSGFKIANNRVYTARPLSKATKAKLLAAAKAYIIKGGPWIAGTIAGKPVVAEYQIKVEF
jgi:hypothetical protein